MACFESLYLLIFFFLTFELLKFLASLLLGLLFNFHKLTHLSILVGIEMQLLNNFIVISQIKGINGLIFVFLREVHLNYCSELLVPVVDCARGQILHLRLVFLPPQLMLGWKVGEACAQEGLICTFITDFRFDLNL